MLKSLYLQILSFTNLHFHLVYRAYQIHRWYSQPAAGNQPATCTCLSMWLPAVYRVKRFRASAYVHTENELTQQKIPQRCDRTWEYCLQTANLHSASASVLNALQTVTFFVILLWKEKGNSMKICTKLSERWRDDLASLEVTPNNIFSSEEPVCCVILYYKVLNRVGNILERNRKTWYADI